jgi:hypothetical protein
MPSTQSKRRAVDTWQPPTNFYHVVSVIVSVIAMSRQQPNSFRFADLHISLCQGKTQFS